MSKWNHGVAGQRPRFVTTVHGLYSVNRYSAFMTRGERVIAVSDTARQYVLENYPSVDPGHVVTIHRGVDPAEFPRDYHPDDDWLDAWHNEYPILQGRRVLTLPGRLTRLKGHADFIGLIAELVGRGMDVHGLIVGHLDPERKSYINELRQLVAARGLQDRITFTGRRDDMREIYAISDLVLSLSGKPESFGRTVLEPLCMGVAAAGYDHGGVGEILARLYPAGRIPRGDAAMLVDCTMRLLDQHPPVETFSDFSLNSMLEHTLDLYRSLADDGSARV